MTLDIITQAKIFATRKHVLDNRQLYAEILPYTHHLADVEAVIRRFRPGTTLLPDALFAAAWLHDVVEDTDVKLRTIEELFGDEVAALVGAVTSEEGSNRKVSNALTYPKIRKTGTLATILKLADRIANVEFGGGASKMYRAEYEDFRHGIFVEPTLAHNEWSGHEAMMMRMWTHLDGLMRSDA